MAAAVGAPRAALPGPMLRDAAAGMAWYGMVWHGMVWYGMVWYGMVWYGMLLYYIPIGGFSVFGAPFRPFLMLSSNTAAGTGPAAAATGAVSQRPRTARLRSAPAATSFRTPASCRVRGGSSGGDSLCCLCCRSCCSCCSGSSTTAGRVRAVRSTPLPGGPGARLL